MWGKCGVLILVADIKRLTYKFDIHKNQSHALHNANKYFYHYYQTGHTTNPNYLETSKNKVSAI